jgi:MFS family permease
MPKFRIRSRPVRTPAPVWFYALVPHKLGIGLIGSLLPLFVVQVVGGTVADVGRISSLTALAGIPAAILWGNLSDHLGRRRPFLLLGLAGYGLTAILISRGQSVGQVMAINVMGGFMMMAINPIASTLIFESAQKGQGPESLGAFNRIGGWSYVAGMVGGTIWLSRMPDIWGTEAAMRGLFLLGGSIAILSLLLGLVWIRDPQKVFVRRALRPAIIAHWLRTFVEQSIIQPPRPSLVRLRAGLGRAIAHYARSRLGWYLGISFLLFAGINAGMVPFPIFLTDVLGATSAQVFLVMVVKTVGDALAYVPMGRFVQKQGGVKVLAWVGLVRVGLLSIYAFMSLIRPGPVGLLIAGGFHLFWGLTWAGVAVCGTSAAAALADKGLEGRTLGVYNAVLGMAGIVGSLAGGYLAAGLGYVVSFGTAAALVGLGALGLAMLHRSRDSQETA